MENAEVVTDGNNYYANIPFSFPRDDSLGNIETQFNLVMDRIYNEYEMFLTDNPEYFYLIPRNYMFSNLMYSKTNLIGYFNPLICYDFPDFDGSGESLAGLKTKYDEMMAVIEETADKLVFDGMTDLDRLLLAHDYIIDNCAYYLIQEKTDNGDGTFTIKNASYGDGYSYNAYGILVNKKGVCQGLSYAYPALLKAMGFPIENIRQIRSDKLKHMWNFVKLDGKWYHVDLTWDDPTVVEKTGDLYDMTRDDLQYEKHTHFLMSDATNTRIRNEEGYQGFTLEILGYDDINPSMANDATYESGYIFNDPVNQSGTEIHGRVEYENGYYKKYFANTDVYFNYDTIKAPKYILSQMDESDGRTYFLGAKNRKGIDVIANLYFCYYDENGRFLKSERLGVKFPTFGKYPITDNPPDGAKEMRIITTDYGTITPIANVPIRRY